MKPSPHPSGRDQELGLGLDRLARFGGELDESVIPLEVGSVTGLPYAASFTQFG